MIKTLRDTPREVIDLLINKAELPNNGQTCYILEPSAGNGAILEVLAEHPRADKFRVDAIELNDEKFRHLSGKLGDDVLRDAFLAYYPMHSDFLNYNKNNTLNPYDRIIAAPPFKDNIDLAHIKHMYNMLLSKGILVSLTTPYWMTNNEEHQVKFRKWLVGKSYSITMIADNTFMEKGRTVPTAIIKIYK